MRRNGRIKKCLKCSKDIYVPLNQERRKKFCSKKCFYSSHFPRKPLSELTKKYHSKLYENT